MNKYEILNRDHEGPLRDPCVEYTANQALRLCKMATGKVILDYGCSIGRAARVFKDHGCIVYGVDVVAENLEKATSYCEETFLRENQSLPMPLEKASFDIVFSSQVIEHLHRRDGEGFIEEAYALLRRGGQIFLATPNLTIFMFSREECQ